MDAKSARTEFRRPEEGLDGSMCRGRSSETVREAPIGRAEEGAMDSIGAKLKYRMEHGQGHRVYVSELSHYAKRMNECWVVKPIK